MNGISLPLYPFPLAFHPVNEASCRPPSPLPKPVAFASHVDGGSAGRSLTYLATLLAVVLSIQVANVVLTSVVADQSVARTQSPDAVTNMALASGVVVVQVSRQLQTPRGRSPSTIAQCLSRERQQQSAKEKQQQS